MKVDLFQFARRRRILGEEQHPCKSRAIFFVVFKYAEFFPRDEAGRVLKFIFDIDVFFRTFGFRDRLAVEGSESIYDVCLAAEECLFQQERLSSFRALRVLALFLSSLYDLLD